MAAANTDQVETIAANAPIGAEYANVQPEYPVPVNAAVYHSSPANWAASAVKINPPGL